MSSKATSNLRTMHVFSLKERVTPSPLFCLLALGKVPRWSIKVFFSRENYGKQSAPFFVIILAFFVIIISVFVFNFADVDPCLKARKTLKKQKIKEYSAEN